MPNAGIYIYVAGETPGWQRVGATQVSMVQAAAATAQAWAESETAPGGSGTMSAKSWAQQAAGFADMLASNDKFVERTSAPNFPIWRAALADRLVGNGFAYLMACGDSTTAFGGGGANLRRFSWPRYLTDRLNEMGLPASDDSIFGCGRQFDPGAPGFDPRISVSANYEDSRITATGDDVRSYSGTGNPSAGGDMFWLTNAGTSALRFLPRRAANLIDVIVVVSPGFGQITCRLNGSSPLPLVGTSQTYFDCNGASALAIATFQAPAAVIGNVDIARNGVGGEAVVPGIICRDSSRPAVHVINGAFGGAKAQDWNSSAHPWSPKNVIGLLRPHLCIVSCGANDRAAGRTASDFLGDMFGIVSKVREVGDAMLIKQHPLSDEWPNPSLTPQYEAQIESLDMPTIDLRRRWVDYATANARGFYIDTVHPSPRGEADIVPPIAAAIMNA